MSTNIDTTPLPNSRITDYRGQQFARLLVVGYAYSSKQNGTYWHCLCDCGNEVVVRIKDLKKGHTKSCGCLSRERQLAGGPNKTHGKSDTVEHNIWIGIKTRCYNPRSTVYRNYGGRGIVMCDRWRDSFTAFYADMGPRPSPQHSIERIDNDGPYSPENCCWATKTEQANNTRSNHLVTHQGITQSVADWARATGIPYKRLRARFSHGMPTEQALSAADFRHVHLVTYHGVTKSIREWATALGINEDAISSRLNAGWSVKRTLTTPVTHRNAGRFYEFKGETKNISEWAAQLGISVSALAKRFRKGWSVERALTTPSHTEKITRH